MRCGLRPYVSKISSNSRAGQASILILADDATLRRRLPPKLQEAGFCVRVAHGVSDAIELAQEQEPDALVLDLVFGSEDAWRSIKPSVDGCRLIVAGKFTTASLAERLRADAYIPGGDISGVVDAVLALAGPAHP